jgi:hypothetical protein
MKGAQLQQTDLFNSNQKQAPISDDLEPFLRLELQRVFTLRGEGA